MQIKLNPHLLIMLITLFHALPPAAQDFLPEEIPWQGSSETLVVPADHPWITKAESSDFRITSSYRETMDYLDRLCSASPLLHLFVIGMSGNHREIPMVIASSEESFSPGDIRNSKRYTLLVQACIHAGEVDGKDAGMMLLRDIAFGGKDTLLEEVNLLFIPILNPDGHERASKYNRANQRGPENMGWRTNARNLNLNRDYTKLDTRELRSVIAVINQFAPDLYMDIHVTDGADYQYDITYGFTGEHGYSPAISGWLKNTFRPVVDEGLARQGHIPGPLMFSMGGGNFERGNIDYMFSPIFSHAYGDLRHLPTILVENHSLKPYKQRVLGTYVLLEESLKILSRRGNHLQKAVEGDQNQALDSLPVSWQVPQLAGAGSDHGKKENVPPPDSMLLLGFQSIEDSSSISGGSYLKWTPVPIQKWIPFYVSDQPTGWVQKAKAYYIPPAWQEVIETLRAHGIAIEYLEQPSEVAVQMYRLEEVEPGNRVFEGRVKVQAAATAEQHVVRFPAKTAVVNTDQPLGDLACYLLEPEAGESLFRWGFFNGILSRTEYMESYILEPLMKNMLQNSTALRNAYEEKMEKDSAFANNPRMIRNWFYRQSPYYDKQYLRYPVGILR